jgi:histidinol dehydrogenase
VDVIAGPGNIFVATAKRMLIGKVGIDMIAGPSEILILADGTARPDQVAADMLSQAEHDTLASSVLITDSAALADAVKAELVIQTKALPRCDIARKALADWGAIVVTDTMDQAVELSNSIAPEHLEVIVADPWTMLPKLRNAGAIFLGANSPEPVGDYFAGPNHVLPTNGTARFSSALSVETFTKKSSIIAASAAFTQANAAKIARLARLEGLEAHARSAESRTR